MSLHPKQMTEGGPWLTIFWVMMKAGRTEASRCLQTVFLPTTPIESDGKNPMGSSRGTSSMKNWSSARSPSKKSLRAAGVNCAVLMIMMSL